MGKESGAQKIESEEEKISNETSADMEEQNTAEQDESDQTQTAGEGEEPKESETDSGSENPFAEETEEDDEETDKQSAESDEPLTPEQIEEKYKTMLAEKEDRYIRLVAEFENFKKRSTQEMQTRFKYANQQLALNIITGLDNLERALVQAGEEEDNSQLQEFVKGIEMVQQQFYDALKQNKIERVYPKGELFDPNNHEAMGVIETDEIEPDHIAEVFQAGYVLHDRVIRPAMVQVAKKK